MLRPREDGRSTLHKEVENCWGRKTHISTCEAEPNQGC